MSITIQMQKTLLWFATAMLLSATTLAASVDVSGVKTEDRTVLEGTDLQLNGAGTRYKGPFKVSAIALYTSKKASSLDELVALPGPKRLTITLLREVDAGAFAKVMTRGMEDNVARVEYSKLVPGLMRMSDIFSGIKVMRQGDVVFLDWIPGTGLVVTLNGKTQGEPFKAPQFYKALMSIWLGKVPADFKLKDALLGVES